MDLELKGKVAIVGGASKGLGRACAQVLADEGAKLALCSRSQKDLDKAAQEIRDTARADVLAFAGDLDRPETVRDLVAATVGRFGRLASWSTIPAARRSRAPTPPPKSSGPPPCSARCCSSRGCRGRRCPI